MVLCNPELVKTGLDLIFAPTLIFYEPVFSLSTMMQASGRSYRLSQKQFKHCKVIYLYYEDTMEAAAIQLMSRKQRAAKLLLGESGLTGLEALTASEGSFEQALMNNIASSTLVDPADLFKSRDDTRIIDQSDRNFWKQGSPAVKPGAGEGSLLEAAVALGATITPLPPNTTTSTDITPAADRVRLPERTTDDRRSPKTRHPGCRHHRSDPRRTQRRRPPHRRHSPSGLRQIRFPPETPRPRRPSSNFANTSLGPKKLAIAQRAIELAQISDRQIAPNDVFDSLTVTKAHEEAARLVTYAASPVPGSAGHAAAPAHRQRPLGGLMTKTLKLDLHNLDLLEHRDQLALLAVQEDAPQLVERALRKYLISHQLATVEQAAAFTTALLNPTEPAAPERTAKQPAKHKPNPPQANFETRLNQHADLDRFANRPPRAARLPEAAELSQLSLFG